MSEEKKDIICPICGAKNKEEANFCVNCGSPLKGENASTIITDVNIFYPEAVIDERYEIKKILGEGGMGVVFYAKDKKLKKDVAIKTLSFTLLKNKEYKERLLREAITLGQIDHPNICSVYDVVIKKEYSYIVMQYIKGDNLDSLLKHGKITTEKALDIGIQLADGLYAAHKKGIVHRDIKPSNIIIDKNGYVKILDFGLAKPFIKGWGGEDNDIKEYEITKTGTIVGTAFYMSPEQAEGGDVDHRSDIFSLGIILYEMFTGKKPFEGTSHISIIMNIINANIIPPSDIAEKIPEGMDEIIKKALMKKPEDRYQTAKELKEDLMKIKRGRNPNKVNIKTKKQNKKKNILKKRVIPIVLGLSLLVLILLLTKYFTGKKPMIVVLNADVGKNVSKIVGEEVSFLLEKSLSQFEDYEITNQNSFKDFQKKWGTRKKAIEKEKVVFFVKPVVRKIGEMINIDTHVDLLNSKKIFTINGEGKKSILEYQIDNIVKRLSNTFNKKKVNIKKISDILTPNWQAFVNFYHGYKFWKNLYISQAEKFFNKALQKDLKLSLAYYYLVEISMFNGDYNLANKFINSAYKNREKLINYDKYKILAMRENLSLNFDKQRKYLKKIIELKPRDKFSYFNLAESFFHRGEARKALIYYAKVLNIDPEFSPALNHAGFCYSYLGNHIKSLDLLEKYKELNGGANAYDSLGDGYFYLGDYLNAQNNKLTALNIDPNLNWIYYSLGYIYFMEHKFEKALDVNKTYAKKSKNKRYQALSMTQLAFFNYYRGNNSKAKQYIDKAEQLYSTKEIYSFKPEIFYFKGLIYLKTGDIKSAKGALSIFETIIKKHHINKKRFFPLLKFYLSLKAHIELKEGHFNKAYKEMEEILLMKEKLGYWSTFFNYSYFVNDYLEVLKIKNKNTEFNHWLKILNDYNPYFREQFGNINASMDK